MKNIINVVGSLLIIAAGVVGSADAAKIKSGSDIIDIKKVDDIVYTIEAENITLVYWESECPNYAKNVVINLYDDAHAGSFDWSMLDEDETKQTMLYEECKRLQAEMDRRK